MFGKHGDPVDAAIRLQRPNILRYPCRAVAQRAAEGFGSVITRSVI